jgi:hypothetical protein
MGDPDGDGMACYEIHYRMGLDARVERVYFPNGKPVAKVMAWAKQQAKRGIVGRT